MLRDWIIQDYPVSFLIGWGFKPTVAPFKSQYLYTTLITKFLPDLNGFHYGLSSQRHVGLKVDSGQNLRKLPFRTAAGAGVFYELLSEKETRVLDLKKAKNKLFNDTRSLPVALGAASTWKSN